MAVNKIQKFIKDNALNFEGKGSELNGNCVVLAGFACHLELTFDELVEKMTEGQLVSSMTELKRVFEYADSHYYGIWWKTNKAKEQFKF